MTQATHSITSARFRHFGIVSTVLGGKQCLTECNADEVLERARVASTQTRIAGEVVISTYVRASADAHDFLAGEGCHEMATDDLLRWVKRFGCTAAEALQQSWEAEGPFRQLLALVSGEARNG